MSGLCSRASRKHDTAPPCSWPHLHASWDPLFCEHLMPSASPVPAIACSSHSPERISAVPVCTCTIDIIAITPACQSALLEGSSSAMLEGRCGRAIGAAKALVTSPANHRARLTSVTQRIQTRR
jgi:hypothetical protein